MYKLITYNVNSVKMHGLTLMQRLHAIIVNDYLNKNSATKFCVRIRCVGIFIIRLYYTIPKVNEFFPERKAINEYSIN